MFEDSVLAGSSRTSARDKEKCRHDCSFRAVLEQAAVAAAGQKSWVFVGVDGTLCPDSGCPAGNSEQELAPSWPTGIVCPSSSKAAASAASKLQASEDQGPLCEA